MPILSIITPVYNAEKTIQGTLASLHWIEEKYRPNVELVLVNDGSTDTSYQLLETFCQGNLLFKTVLLNQNNMGTAAARNRGIKASTGEWIFFLDADDELNFNPIAWIQQYSTYTAIGFSVGLYKGGRRYFTQHPTCITEKNFWDVFTSRNPFHPSCVLFKKEQMDSLFNPEFIFLEDWLFWSMNPGIFKKMIVFPKTKSVKVLIHERNKSCNHLKNGEFREKVADNMLESYGTTLTRKQRNNLLIQKEIGKIQQGISTSLSMFARMPCSFQLYIKLIIYFSFRRINEKINFYAQ